MIEGVVKLIHEAGGRFLTFDEDTCKWFELTHRATTDKIGHALRFSRGSKRKSKGERRERKKDTSELSKKQSTRTTESTNADDTKERERNRDSRDRPKLYTSMGPRPSPPPAVQERRLSWDKSVAKAPSSARTSCATRPSRTSRAAPPNKRGAHAIRTLKKIAQNDHDGDDSYVYKRLRLLYDMRLLVSLTRILNDMDKRESVGDDHE
eukprot:CAMPEP_0194031486 /NCGR_PEP_ID=MMETSP0009_2-20130614/4649_1 /TAXON_ID=210454 /ORGANISM="Grammatophora oceanica, Strain CCMP 410" /LENGTH=207 /DNA_ID=CAMNT_0038671655 /DNA_START=1 /DNA_END=624 /DNA_ORIENTATION=-